MAKTTEWMCTWCGKRQWKAVIFGRPLPGICPKKGNNRPHTWVKNKTING